MQQETIREPEPRWPALLALFAVAALYFALPSALTPGPDWLLLALVIVLATPAMLSHRRGKHRLGQIFGYTADRLFLPNALF